MRIRNAAMTVAAAVAMIGGVPAVPAAASGHIANPFKVHSRWLGDCEDDNPPVCFMKDEGQWRVVTSFDPYRFRAVSLCNARRSNLPCLTKGRTVRGPLGGRVQLRRFVYRGTL